MSRRFAARRLAGVEVDLRPEQVVHHRGHERARQEVRHHHREDDRHPERREERRAAPEMNTTGMKTMQMQSVATNAGTAICCAPSRMAWTMGFLHRHVAVHVLDLDGGVVDQDPDGERQAPQGHQVERLPEARQAMSDTRIDSGIDVTTMSVLRQLPRKSRIMSAVSPRRCPPP
jgi:hypothetical protein